MKKFLIFVFAAGILCLSAFYATSLYGFYIDFHPDAPIKADFTAEERRILDASGDIFQVKGVEISASIPEHASSEFEPEKEDYIRWFEQIAGMGANTLKAAGIMDDTFYEAFGEYNSRAETPLYLLQGILVQDSVNFGTGDAYDHDFMDSLIGDGKRAVDVVHGNRMISGNVPGRGSGWYTADVSRWVLGFLVGSQWGSDTVAYTDHESFYSGKYEGEYFYTTEEARPFESMLARVMDEILSYESGKYKEQHLIGFVNEPQTDPLEYRDDYGQLREPYSDVGEGITYARQLGKICQVDAEHIKATEKVVGGYYAAYSIYDFCTDFYKYLSEEQTEKSREILKDLDTDDTYGGYLNFLGEYHTVPLICTSYGFSSSRGVVSEKGFPLTEVEQGERLTDVYLEMREAGWSGAVINSWQDRWELKSWNTAYSQDFTNNSLWHDLQTETQGYGLMKFVSQGRVIDGKADDWEEKDLVCSSGSLKLYAYADAEGLDLLVTGAGEDSELYIPIDITEKSGSRSEKTRNLNFSDSADFLLCVSGREDTRLLVHSRYESVRANFLNEINGEDPYIEFPEADSEEFVPVYMVMENKTMVKAVNYENRELKYLPVSETGKFRHGNGDMEAADYDSLADFCFGEDCMEIRIPWALLNFANPAEMLIHDDYYENYGVKFMKTDSMKIGVSPASPEEIEMNDFALDWNSPEYEEKLKQSYRVVQSVWGE